MSLLRLTPSLLLVAVLALVGCTKSRTEGTGEVPIDRLDDELVDAYCDLLFRCGLGGDGAEIRLLLDSPGQCETFLGRSLREQGDLTELQRLVSSGAVSYDGEAARACLDEVQRSCGAIGGSGSPVDSCEDVFVGTVPDGGACYLDEECLGDAYCDLGGTGICPGLCTARGPLGSACDSASECTREGLSGSATCSYGGVVSECVDTVWTADAAAGAACGQVSSEGYVRTWTACAAGLFCTGDETPGVCQAPIAAGSPCPGRGVCVEGSICIDGACREVTVVRNVGDACGEAMLAFCDPFARLECGETGTCVALGDGTEGSPCRGGDFGELTCNEGLSCHSDTDTCGPPKAAGASCGRDAECASRFCDYRTETCGERYCEG